MGGVVMSSTTMLNDNGRRVSEHLCSSEQSPISTSPILVEEKCSGAISTLAPYDGQSTSCRQPWLTTVQSWAVWMLSVVVTASVIAHVQNGGFKFVPGIFGHWVNDADNKSINEDIIMKSNRTSNSRLPRRASCASGGVRGNDYNLPLHVGALFIILFVSGTACAFPILATKFPRLRIPPGFLFAARHFGTGVLIATAFVHLLPTAFITLGDPCLSNFWTTDYPAMPGAIILAAVFFVMLIEMIFSPAGQHVCSGPQPDLDEPRQQPNPTTTAQTAQEQKGHGPRPKLQSVDSSKSLRNFGPLVGRSSSISRTVARMGEENEILDSFETAQRATHSKEAKMAELSDEDPERNNSSAELSPQQKDQKAIVQCVLLEVGILFHSVFIGMSLSVSIGNENI